MSVKPCPWNELSEWQSCFISDVFLTPEDRPLVEQLGQAGQVEIDELRTGVRIKARSWVGVIRFSNFELRIVPKLAGDYLGLVEMLAFTTGLDALRRNRGIRQLQLEKNCHLFDLVALLFAEACEQITRKGLIYDYIEQEADLPVVRGRLLAGQQLRRRFGRVDRLECRYDDHLSNVIENQILAVTLAVCRPKVAHPLVGLRIHRLHSLFSEACMTDGLDLREAREAVVYNRLNEFYREAHQLAWLILDGLAIDDLLKAGQTRSFAFLLDMNRLFELFIFHWVKYILQDEPCQIHYQRQDRSVIWDVTHKRPYSHLTPDLLIESGSPPQRLVIDAKYKTYDEHRLNPADIYQSFLYAYAYQTDQASVPEALLLYPASQHGPSVVKLSIRGAISSGCNVQAMNIHIPQVLSEIDRKLKILGPEAQRLVEVIRRRLTQQAV